MNKAQVKHYRTFRNTQDFPNNSTPAWSVIPRIVAYKNDFDELLTRTTDISESVSEITGVTNRKDNLNNNWLICMSNC